MQVHESRKRRAVEELLAQPRSAPTTLDRLFSENQLDDLPIFAFLTRNDRLNLTETCSSLRNAVESYSKRNFQAIFDIHQVDDNFVDHITAQGHLQTSRRRPLILPYRYMLYKAMNSYLYKLQNVDNDGAQWVIQARLSGDGTRLVTMLRNGLVQVWDLLTKECVQTIQHDFWNGDDPVGFILQDNRIILRGDNHVVSWDMQTGCLCFVTSLENDSFREDNNIVSISRNKSLVLGNAEGVKTIDTDSGDVLVGELLSWPPPEYGLDGDAKTWLRSNVFVCHDNWFVFAAWWVDLPDRGGRAAGIFVFSLKDFQLVSHNPVPFQRYNGLSQSTDDPGTFVAAGNGNVDVYTVNTDGLLQLRNTFTIPVSDHGGGPLFATASHVYLRGSYQLNIGRKVDVYDIDTGRLQRCLVCPCQMVCALTIWKDGNEIILGLANGLAVAAYCLVEPEQQSR